jgi:hypothetical protein
MTVESEVADVTWRLRPDMMSIEVGRILGRWALVMTARPQRRGVSIPGAEPGAIEAGVLDQPRVHDVDDRHGGADTFAPVGCLSEHPSTVQAHLTVHTDVRRVLLSHSAPWAAKNLCG